VEVKQSELDGVTLLELSGRLIGGPQMYELHERIKKLVKDGCIDIVLDLGGVTMIDSFSLGIVLACHHSLEREGGSLKLCSLNETVRDVFYITLLSKVLRVHATREEAIASSRSAGG
jgi:anti-sigma B factor antagonist